MTKKEVAALLGKSDRQVSNYASTGRLSVEYVTVNGIRVGKYNEAEVAKLKAELDAESRPATVVTNRFTPVAEDSHPATSKAISPMKPAFQTVQGDAVLFASALSESITKGFEKANSMSQANLSVQMLLTIPEAMILSGLKEKPIRDAIKAGDLKSIRIGRSIQVRPNDLQKWVDSKFSN
jgi:predicted DNA-binding transcriptional regulator AlpA